MENIRLRFDHSTSTDASVNFTISQRKSSQVSIIGEFENGKSAYSDLSVSGRRTVTIYTGGVNDFFFQTFCQIQNGQALYYSCRLKNKHETIVFFMLFVVSF